VRADGLRLLVAAVAIVLLGILLLPEVVK